MAKHESHMNGLDGMNIRQRIDFLEEVARIGRRELNVVSIQLLAVTASSDPINYPSIKTRRRALLLSMAMALEELEQLYEQEEGDPQRSR